MLAESISLKAEAQKKAEKVVEAARVIANAFAGGNKVLLFGNGGSAADAQHMAGEFVNRLIIERPPLPAIALTTDSSVLTSIGNDYSYDDIFAKQIQALAQPGDIAWAFSTSGNSPNIVKGLEAARARQMSSIVMTGQGGGQAAPLADLLLSIDSVVAPRIQEVHITWGHIICDLVDYILFEKPGEELGS